MATLELEFNCMCVFVPEPSPGGPDGQGSMHVIMPSTRHHHGGGQEHAGEVHVVRMLHPSFLPAHPKGLSMEGWALTLGEGAPPSASTALDPGPNGETLVNLTPLAGGAMVPHRMVQDQFNDEVNARVTLGSGALQTDKIRSEAKWKFGGTDIRMAFRASWMMEVDPDRPLQWFSLDATAAPPIRSLRELTPEADGHYKITIYHVPERTLPPDPGDNGRLELSQVKEHFRALYVLFGIQNPTEDMLPQPPTAVGTGHCGLPQALLEPAAMQGSAR